MLGQRMSQREVEKILGLTGDRPVHQLLKRKRKKVYMVFVNLHCYKFPTIRVTNIKNLFLNSVSNTAI